MEGFTAKTVKVSRGYTYRYFVPDGSNSIDKSLPSLFFCHGWPDDAHLWLKMSTYLRTLPFNMIIPDLLGYCGTDKPSDVQAYNMKDMSQDLAEIADAENASKVIVVGHDWGSYVAARFYNFHPNRVVGVVLLNVVYLAPSKDKFDLDAVNAFTTQIFGYPIYQYWHLFTDPKAPELFKKHAERLYAALHAKGETSMKDFFTNPDAFPTYLVADTPEPEVRPYAQDPAFREHYLNKFKNDPLEGAMNYYIAMKDNIQSESDKHIPDEDYRIKVPFLYVGADQDAVCRPEMLDASRGLIDDCEEGPIAHSGHWSPYEAPKEMADPMIDWLKKKFLSQGKTDYA